MSQLTTIILLGAGAFLLSFALSPATVKISNLIGAIDTPDGDRKINTRCIPRLGGLGFFLSFFLLSLPLLTEADKTLSALLCGGALIVAGGVSDDAGKLPPISKLLFQLAAGAAALLIIDTPTRISFFGLFSATLPMPLGFAFALFRIVFTCNAVNFSDGLDGLASGLSIAALLSLSIFGLQNGETTVAAVAFILAAAVLGFLPYNKYRAKIFMGDCGSQFLGFAIAILSLGASPDGSFPTETVFFLAVPVLDTWFSIVRRLLSGKSPFKADKGHLHHFLLSKGIPHPQAVKILVAASALIGGAALFILKF